MIRLAMALVSASMQKPKLPVRHPRRHGQTIKRVLYSFQASARFGGILHLARHESLGMPAHNSHSSGLFLLAHIGTSRNRIPPGVVATSGGSFRPVPVLLAISAVSTAMACPTPTARRTLPSGPRSASCSVEPYKNRDPLWVAHIVVQS